MNRDCDCGTKFEDLYIVNSMIYGDHIFCILCKICLRMGKFSFTTEHAISNWDEKISISHYIETIVCKKCYSHNVVENFYPTEIFYDFRYLCKDCFFTFGDDDFEESYIAKYKVYKIKKEVG